MKTSAVRGEWTGSAAGKLNFWPVAVPLICFAWFWLEAINQLRPEWSLNPQYGYGWSVPFLALYLFWKRWTTRPASQPVGSWIWSALGMIGCAVAFLPIRFVAEANPDWRMLSWALALSCVIASLSFLYLVGGKGWIFHFAFPCIFFLVAVPWPAQLEQFVIQNLMRAVTAINVLLLNLSGIPALRHGNVIEVGSGLIGIEEACSGVRSLQATLMISLFFGEFYGFSGRRRVLLVAAGAMLAFICNLVRTALLVWVGANRGTGAIESWHDPAGLTILMICLFGLWCVSLVMHRSVAIPAGESNARPNDVFYSPVSLTLCGVIAAWLLCAEFGVQAWYNAHASAFTASRWSVQWPTAEPSYKTVPITPEAERLLAFNDGGGAAWHDSDGHQWMMYFFRWLPGQTAARFVKIHRPDICLPASGMTLDRDNGIQLLNLNGVKLPIRSYRFDNRGAPLHVFYCYWDARSSYDSADAATAEDWSPLGRIRAALKGRREIGAQMLEIVVSGYDQDNDAAAAFMRELERIVRPS